MRECDADLFLQYIHHILPGDAVILRQECFHPLGVLHKLLIASDILALCQIIRKSLHLIFQSGRQHSKSHNLDQSDILLLDVMILRMRMINSKRMLLCSDIVPQGQIQLEDVSHLPCDRRDRIVRFSVCLCIDKCSFIRISSPRSQNMICQFNQALLILMPDTENRQRPFDNSRFHVLIPRYRHGLFNRRFCHGKCIVAALEMVMAQDRSANDRKIRVGSQEIVREQLDKVE